MVVSGGAQVPLQESEEEGKEEEEEDIQQESSSDSGDFTTVPSGRSVCMCRSGMYIFIYLYIITRALIHWSD